MPATMRSALVAHTGAGGRPCRARRSRRPRAIRRNQGRLAGAARADEHEARHAVSWYSGAS